MANLYDELILEGVMHFVDKWLDTEEELSKDPVNRAILAREKALSIIENLEKENESLQKDVLDIVRCYECRRCYKELDPHSQRYSLMCGCFGMHVPYSSFFCAYGEREKKDD